MGPVNNKLLSYKKLLIIIKYIKLYAKCVFFNFIFIFFAVSASY